LHETGIGVRGIISTKKYEKTAQFKNQIGNAQNVYWPNIGVIKPHLWCNGQSALLVVDRGF